MTLLFLAFPFGLAGMLTQKGNEVANEIQHSPFFTDLIGEVESCNSNPWRSLTAGKGKMVYNARCPKGKGKLIVFDRVLRVERYWLEVGGQYV